MQRNINFTTQNNKIISEATIDLISYAVAMDYLVGGK